MRRAPAPIPLAALVVLGGFGFSGGLASLALPLPLPAERSLPLALLPSQIQPLQIQPLVQAQSHLGIPPAAAPGHEALPADRIPVGALLLSRPANALELQRVVEQEILPAIEEGRFSPGQARAFIRAQQKRLHLWNPNGTHAFNRLLWRRDIRD